MRSKEREAPQLQETEKSALDPHGEVTHQWLPGPDRGLRGRWARDPLTGHYMRERSCRAVQGFGAEGKATMRITYCCTATPKTQCFLCAALCTAGGLEGAAPSPMMPCILQEASSGFLEWRQPRAERTRCSLQGFTSTGVLSAGVPWSSQIQHWGMGTQGEDTQTGCHWCNCLPQSPRKPGPSAYLPDRDTVPPYTATCGLGPTSKRFICSCFRQNR